MTSRNENQALGQNMAQSNNSSVNDPLEKSGPFDLSATAKRDSAQRKITSINQQNPQAQQRFEDDLFDEEMQTGDPNILGQSSNSDFIQNYQNAQKRIGGVGNKFKPKNHQHVRGDSKLSQNNVKEYDIEQNDKGQRMLQTQNRSLQLDSMLLNQEHGAQNVQIVNQQPGDGIYPGGALSQSVYVPPSNPIDPYQDQMFSFHNQPPNSTKNSESERKGSAANGFENDDAQEQYKGQAYPVRKTMSLKYQYSAKHQLQKAMKQEEQFRKLSAMKHQQNQSAKDDGGGQSNQPDQIDQVQGQEWVKFLAMMKQQVLQLQERLKLEIRHKLTLIKQVSTLKKELKQSHLELEKLKSKDDCCEFAIQTDITQQMMNQYMFVDQAYQNTQSVSASFLPNNTLLALEHQGSFGIHQHQTNTDNKDVSMFRNLKEEDKSRLSLDRSKLPLYDNHAAAPGPPSYSRILDMDVTHTNPNVEVQNIDDTMGASSIQKDEEVSRMFDGKMNKTIVSFDATQIDQKIESDDSQNMEEVFTGNLQEERNQQQQQIGSDNKQEQNELSNSQLLSSALGFIARGSNDANKSQVTHTARQIQMDVIPEKANEGGSFLQNDCQISHQSGSFNAMAAADIHNLEDKIEGQSNEKPMKRIPLADSAFKPPDYSNQESHSYRQRNNSVSVQIQEKFRTKSDNTGSRKGSYVRYATEKQEDFKLEPIDDAEQRRKIQEIWRRKVNKERISQLIEEKPELWDQGIDNSVLLRSNSYKPDFNFPTTRNSQGPQITEESPRDQSLNVSGVDRVQANYFRQTSAGIKDYPGYQHQTQRTQSVIKQPTLGRDRFGSVAFYGGQNINDKSQYQMDNYWKDKVELLTGEKKEWLQLSKEMKKENKELKAQIESYKRKIKDLTAVINRLGAFEDDQLDFGDSSSPLHRPSNIQKEKLVGNMNEEVTQENIYNKSINFTLDQRALHKSKTQNVSDNQTIIQENIHLDDRDQLIYQTQMESVNNEYTNRRSTKDQRLGSARNDDENIKPSPIGKESRKMNNDGTPSNLKNINENDVSRYHNMNATTTSIPSIPQTQNMEIKAMKNRYQTKNTYGSQVQENEEHGIPHLDTAFNTKIQDSQGQLRSRGEKIRSNKKSGQLNHQKYIKYHEGDQSYDLDGDESRPNIENQDLEQMQGMNMQMRSSIKDLNRQQKLHHKAITNAQYVGQADSLKGRNMSITALLKQKDRQDRERSKKAYRDQQQEDLQRSQRQESISMSSQHQQHQEQQKPPEMPQGDTVNQGSGKSPSKKKGLGIISFIKKKIKSNNKELPSEKQDDKKKQRKPNESASSSLSVPTGLTCRRRSNAISGDYNKEDLSEKNERGRSKSYDKLDSYRKNQQTLAQDGQNQQVNIYVQNNAESYIINNYAPPNTNMSSFAQQQQPNAAAYQYNNNTKNPTVNFGNLVKSNEIVKPQIPQHPQTTKETYNPAQRDTLEFNESNSSKRKHKQAGAQELLIKSKQASDSVASMVKQNKDNQYDYFSKLQESSRQKNNDAQLFAQSPSFPGEGSQNQSMTSSQNNQVVQNRISAPEEEKRYTFNPNNYQEFRKIVMQQQQSFEKQSNASAKFGGSNVNDDSPVKKYQNNQK